MRRISRPVAVCAVVVLLLGSTLAGAAYLDQSVPVSGDITLETNTGVSVTYQTATDGQLNTTSPFLNDSAVQIESKAGNATVVGQQSANVTVQFGTAPWTNLTSLDVSNGPVTAAVENMPAVTVEGQASSASVLDGQTDDGDADIVLDTQTGQTTLTVRTLSAAPQVAAVNASGDVVDTASAADGSATFDIPAGQYTIFLQTTDGPPELSDPAPVGELSSTPDTLSLNVSDADFPADNVTLVWRLDGTVVNTTYATSEGKYTTPVTVSTAGTHNVSVAATDEYGQTRTLNWTFGNPTELGIRSTAAGNPYIKGQEVNLTFTQNGSVFERTTTTGNASLDGLPAQGSLIVRAETSGYITRRSVIRDLAAQQDIYLLPDTATTVTSQFTLEDRSGGRYPPETTRLIIKRPIEQPDGSLAYKTVAGGTFGAANEYTVELEQDEDYRLAVLSADGEYRVIGSYTATDSGIEQLAIGRFAIGPDTDSGVSTRFEMFTEDTDGDGTDERYLRVGFRDPDRASDEFDFNITTRENGTLVATDRVPADGLGKYVATFQVPADATGTTYVLNWEIGRGDEVITGTEYAGDVPAVIASIPMDPRWLELLGMLAIVATGGLVVIVNGALGAVAAVAVASLLSILGVVAIPSAALGLAGSVAVLALFGRSNP